MIETLFLFFKILFGLIVGSILLGLYLQKKGDKETDNYIREKERIDQASRGKIVDAYIQCPVCESITHVKSIQCKNCKSIGSLIADIDIVAGMAMVASLIMKCKKCDNSAYYDKCQKCNINVTSKHLKVPGVHSWDLK